MTDVITERSILNGEQQPDDGQSLLFCVSLFLIAIRCVGIYSLSKTLDNDNNRAVSIATSNASENEVVIY